MATPLSETPGSSRTREALRQLQDDPDRVWRELVEKSSSKLRVLLAFERDRGAFAGADEDDLLQEVWAEAMRSIDRFEYRGPGSLHRWFVGILRNKVLHARRSTARQRVQNETDVVAGLRPQPNRGLLDALHITQSGVSRDARWRELEEKVLRVLATLQEPQRAVLLMKIYEGLTGREIAQRLGVDESTVSVRFRRALRACSAQLKDSWV